MPYYFGRTRTRSYGAVEGTRSHHYYKDWHIEYTETSRVSPLFRDLCHDTCGYPEEHALYLKHEQYGTFVRSGQGSNGWEYFSYPTGFNAVPNYSSLEDVDSFATRAAAKTNPGKSHIDLPVFLFELRELPKMIRDAGLAFNGRAPRTSTPKRLGSAYLSWQFGWKPLIQDLSSLVDFTQAVEKRKEEIRQLITKGGYTGKYTDHSGVGGGENHYLITLNTLPWVVGRVTSTTSVRRWAKTRWKPELPPALLKDDRELARIARRSVLGLSAGQVTTQAWKAIPWTWLIDWFTNIGNCLQATNNSIASLTSGIPVMTHSVTVGIPGIESVGEQFDYTVVVSPGSSAKYELKERYLASLSPFKTSMPILNGGQLGILTALFAQMDKRRR